MDITQVSVILALLLSIFNLWDKIETRVRKDTGNKYVYIYYLAECFEEDEEDRVVVSMY